MMLSMVPAAGAAEVPEAAEPEIAVEEITSREDLAREIESAQLADAAKLTDEESPPLKRPVTPVWRPCSPIWSAPRSPRTA